MQCEVRCGVSREGHGRDRVSLNYRSFMFGKLPPPACPGLCYVYLLLCVLFSNKFINYCLGSKKQSRAANQFKQDNELKTK